MFFAILLVHVFVVCILLSLVQCFDGLNFIHRIGGSDTSKTSQVTDKALLLTGSARAGIFRPLRKGGKRALINI